jgi:hypothetical protein
LPLVRTFGEYLEFSPIFQSPLKVQSKLINNPLTVKWEEAEINGDLRLLETKEAINREEILPSAANNNRVDSRVALEEVSKVDRMAVVVSVEAKTQMDLEINSNLRLGTINKDLRLGFLPLPSATSNNRVDFRMILEAISKAARRLINLTILLGINNSRSNIDY